MKHIFTKEWFEAALVRAIKTFAQNLLGSITLGLAIKEINWTLALSVATVSAIYSILTSIAGLPEVGEEGTLEIDTSNPEKDFYRFVLNDDVSTLANHKTVRFKVNPNADLSSVPEE